MVINVSIEGRSSVFAVHAQKHSHALSCFVGGLGARGRHISHARRFFDEIGLGHVDPLPLGVDNSAARDLAYNPEHHARVKHIKRRHFFIRECVENMEITVPYVNTHENLADFFTKWQDPKLFRSMRDIIMNVPSHAREDLSASPGGS